MFRKVIGFFLVCVMVSVCVSCQSNKITVEQYNQVEDGMTYDQVKEIFQSDGKVTSERGDVGTEDYAIRVKWRMDKSIVVTLYFEGPDLKCTKKLKSTV